MKMIVRLCSLQVVRFLGLILFSSVLLTTGVFSQACFLNVANLPVLSIAEASADENWKNFYGIAWPGGTDVVDDSISYANQMGHGYIAVSGGAAKRNLYNNNAARAGLKFYIIDPEKLQDLIPTIKKL